MHPHCVILRSPQRLSAVCAASGTIVLILGLLLAPACGGGGHDGSTGPKVSTSQLMPSKFVYSGGADVEGAQIDDATGQLSPIAGSPYQNATSTEMDSLVVDPRGKFLYTSAHSFGVAGQPFGQTGIDGFAIDSGTGVLTHVPGAPFASDEGAIVMHPSGKWLFMQGIDSYNVYAIDPVTGALAVAPGSPFPAADVVGGFSVFSADGAFMFYFGQDATLTFLIDQQSGKPTLVTGPVSNAVLFGDYHPAMARVSRDGLYIYVVAGPPFRDLDHPNPDILIALKIGAAASLTPVPGARIVLENQSNAMAVAPGGRFIYISVTENNPLVRHEIQAFSVNSATGALSPVPGSPFRPDTAILGLAIDHSEEFLYAPTGDNCLTFRIDPNTDAPTQVATSPQPRQFLIVTVP